MFATKKAGSPHPIYGVDRGDIIQMYSPKTGLPHAVIVKSNNGVSMSFVEANIFNLGTLGRNDTSATPMWTCSGAEFLRTSLSSKVSTCQNC